MGPVHCTNFYEDTSAENLWSYAVAPRSHRVSWKCSSEIWPLQTLFKMILTHIPHVIFYSKSPLDFIYFPALSFLALPLTFTFLKLLSRLSSYFYYAFFKFYLIYQNGFWIINRFSLLISYVPLINNDALKCQQEYNVSEKFKLMVRHDTEGCIFKFNFCPLPFIPSLCVPV